MLAQRSLKVSTVVAAAAVVGGGAAYTGYSLYKNSSLLRIRPAYADAPPGPKKIFAASGFVDLKLESSEPVNHNVKKLRFALPDADAVTGLQPICNIAPPLNRQA
jgi:cytochrome-b5 reductase